MRQLYLKARLITVIITISLGISVSVAQPPDTTLLKYTISKDEKTLSIKDKKRWRSIALEDILDKKVYTKGIAASRFGGERKGIELKEELLPKELERPASLIKELPVELKQKLDKMKKEVTTERQKLGLETIELGIKSIPGEEKITPSTLSVKEREKEEMKLAAIKALGVTQNQTAISYLKEQLEAEKPEIKRAAAEALARTGETAGLEVLHSALEEELAPAQDKVEVIKSLGRAGRVTSIPPLRKMLDNKDKRVSKEASFALARMKDERGISALYEWLNSGSFDEKFESAIVLAEIGDKSGIEVLKKGIKAAQSDIRLKAVRSLGMIGDDSMIPLLQDIMKSDSDPGVRIAASESILIIKRREK